MLEGAPVARATATGMAAVSAALLSALKTGDHVVAARAMFGSCLHVVTEILPRFGITHTLVDGGDIAAVAGGDAAQHPHAVPGDAVQSHACPSSTESGGEDRRRGGRLCWWWTMPSPARPCSGRWNSAPISWCIPRPNISTARAAPWAAWSAAREDFYDKHLQPWIRNTGPVDQPLQCLAASEKPGDAGPAHEAALRECRQGGRLPGRPAQGDARALSLPRRSSAAQSGPRPDGRRRRRRRVRDRRRQESGVQAVERAGHHRHLQQSGRRQEPASPIPKPPPIPS